MSSVVSSIIGGNAQENVAQTQANQSDYAVNVNAGTTTRGQDIQNAQFNQGLLEQEKEYGNTQDVANQGLATAAAGIDATTGAAPAELTTLQGDIENKNTRAMADTSKQVGANLATAGVRGGQATILQNRAVGEQGLGAQEDIDQLLAQNAATREAQKAGYYTQLGAGAMSKVGAS